MAMSYSRRKRRPSPIELRCRIPNSSCLEMRYGASVVVVVVVDVVDAVEEAASPEAVAFCGQDVRACAPQS